MNLSQREGSHRAVWQDWLSLCNQRGRTAPGSRLSWSLKCSWHVFYNHQPRSLPVANCMHISAPWAQPGFLHQSWPAAASPAPNEGESPYNEGHILSAGKGGGWRGPSGSPALPGPSVVVLAGDRRSFWWLEMNHQVYSLHRVLGVGFSFSAQSPLPGPTSLMNGCREHCSQNGKQACSLHWAVTGTTATLGGGASSPRTRITHRSLLPFLPQSKRVSDLFLLFLICFLA